MPGLLRRAKDLVQQYPYLRVLSQEEAESDEDGISEDERRRIAAQIQSVVESNRISINAETFRVKPAKRGWVMVVAVNILALLLVGGSLYGALWYFDQQEETLVAPEIALVSAEGLLLETLQEEAEARLSEKEDEIRSIEGRLAEINAERDRLASETDAIVAEREAAIRAEFDQRIAAERERLSATGLSAAEVEAEIAQLQQSQQEALADQINEVRAAAEAEIAEREAAIAQLEEEFQSRLSSAEAEREGLEAERSEIEARYQAELAAEIEDVRAEAATEAAAIEAERVAAIGALDDLRTQREQEEFTVARLTALYAAAQGAIVNADYSRALEEIDEIGAFLSEPSVVALPAIQRRRDVDIFLSDTLSELVVTRQREQNVDTTSLVATAALVEAAAELVTSADALLESGDSEEAARLYRAAVNRIPATAVGLERLEELEDQASAEDDLVLAQLVSSANQAYRAAQYDLAAERYATVVDYLPVEDAALYASILDTGYQLRAAVLLAEQRDAIAAVEDAAATETEAAAARIADLENQIAELTAAVELRAAELRSAQDEGAATGDELSDLREQLEIARQDTRLATERAVEAEAALAELAGREPAVESGPSPYASFVRSYRRRYDASVNLAGTAGRRSAIDLLETKLLILRITRSEAIRSEFPELYDDTQRMFDDLVATERADAEVKALAGLAVMLESILSERSATVADRSGAIPQPGSAEADRLLREILGGLERLTESIAQGT